MLNTIMADGALTEAGRPASPTQTPIGHGQWVRAGERLFTATPTFLTYDTQGARTGMHEITRSIRLSADLQTFRPVSRNERLDLEGKVVFSGTATETARRRGIGDPPPARQAAAEGAAMSRGGAAGAWDMRTAGRPPRHSHAQSTRLTA